MECKICQEELVPSHPYKVHKLTLEKYMYEYYPKVDLLTGEKIIFKRDIEGYLLSDFTGKLNLKKWLKSQTLDKQKEYLTDILLRRKNLKQLEFIPTQFEQRSIENGVGINTYNKIFKEGYYKLCESLGYKSRNFNNLIDKTILKSVRSLRNNPILVDTRESDYLSFGNKTIELQALNVADYGLKNNNFNIWIERKELGDLINTISAGFERFKKELVRARESNSYIILLCESPISDFLSFNYLPWLSKKIQATPSFISHRLRELLQQFPMNFQIGFCNGRGQMKDIILKIFEMEDYWKYHDIQLGLDLNLFETEI